MYITWYDMMCRCLCIRVVYAVFHIGREEERMGQGEREVGREGERQREGERERALPLSSFLFIAVQT